MFVSVKSRLVSLGFGLLIKTHLIPLRKYNAHQETEIKKDLGTHMHQHSHYKSTETYL